MEEPGAVEPHGTTTGKSFPGGHVTRKRRDAFPQSEDGSGKEKTDLTSVLRGCRPTAQRMIQ